MSVFSQVPTLDQATKSADDSTTTLAEGQIYDFITNKPVKDKPAERTLQTVARSLVEEYGFDQSQLRRDQTVTYKVINDQGRTRTTRRKVSIVVYPRGVSQKGTDQIIRACLVQSPNIKATDRKKGVGLLEEVMGALPNCDSGLWTNGTDLVFKQKLTGGGRLEPEYIDLYDLPGDGETAADLDRPDRQARRIATGDNLQRTFARVHDYIYGNQGLKKDVAFWQVLNLIFCKIHDERTPGQRRFWVKGTERNTAEGQAAIAERITSLFNEVMHDSRYASIFSKRDAIELDDRVLAYVVGELSRYNLLDTDVDVKGAAYEEITASNLKAQRGQFFTPTNIIRLMVQMVDPSGDGNLTDRENWPRILDPACGTGRFLTYAFDHIRHKLADQLYPDEHPLLRIHRLNENGEATQLLREYAKECLYGIDFDPDLKRAARMNMILNNDGHGNILSLNSLEYPLMLGRTKVGQLRRKYAQIPKSEWPDPVRVRLDAHLDTFDLVFSNPPFGAKIPIDDPNILDQFDLAYRWKRQGDHWVKGPKLHARVAPEVLFVERCVRWVKPGTGKVALVLPDGILGNPSAEYIRYWILTNCQVLASVDLPVEAFLPQVGIQVSLLFLRRKSQAEMDAEAMGQRADYPIFLAIADKVGHDRRGKTIYERHPDGTEKIFAEQRTVLRRQGGRLVPVTITTQSKRVDDDLPRIAKTYQQFLQTGEVST